MKTGWIIKKDFCISPFDSKTFRDVTIVGPRDVQLNEQELLKGHLFRMFDDDGVLYYEGYFVGDHCTEDAFQPLDHFGTPNAGCTRIDYWNDFEKIWETL
jgi:hypothetical protein